MCQTCPEALHQCAVHVMHMFQCPMSCSCDGNTVLHDCSECMPESRHILAASVLFQIQVHKLLGQWCAVEMEYFSPRSGWYPFSILAPARRQAFVVADVGQPEPLTADAWSGASILAKQALEHVHQSALVEFDKQQRPSVHGDVRLPEIVGHLGESNTIDRVIFVDFEWAGAGGISRYLTATNFAMPHWH